MTAVRRAALFATLAAMAAVGCAPAQLDRPGPGTGAMDVVGYAEYAWPLQTLAGDTLSLDAFRGRPLFINLWATWCPPCIAELASIDALRRRAEVAETVFLIVSPEPADRVHAFLRRQDWELPAYVERAAMPDAFGLRALPTTFIVDRDGAIVLRHRGAADWNDDAVADLLAYLATSVQ